MKAIFELTILFLFSVYVSILYATGKITFFIHPRYVTFTYVFALLAAFVACVGFVLWWERRNKPVDEHHHEKKPGKLSGVWQYGAIVLTLVVAFVLPVRPLSIATAQQREIDFNSLSYNQKGALDSFFRDSEGYDLGDWVVTLNYDPDPANYVGKKVRVSGFAYKSDSLPAGTFRLARFVITCCAVDARPVGLLVKDTSVTDNKWYEVQGEFALDKESSELVIISSNIKQIDEPKDPYIF
jgi:putative membrane protein